MKITHVGEKLVAGLINNNPKKFFKTAGIEDLSKNGTAQIEVKLNELFCGRRFDGAHKVDVVVPISKTHALAVEVKLGTSNLSAGVLNKKFEKCQPSDHKNKRWNGTLLAILNRDFETVKVAEDLVVEFDDQKKYILQDTWVLVVRRSTLANWKAVAKNYRKIKVIAIEDFVDGSFNFNELVTGIIAGDFYKLWNLDS